MKRLAILLTFSCTIPAANGFDGVSLSGNATSRASAQLAADAAARAAANASTRAATTAATNAAARASTDAAVRTSTQAAVRASTDAAVRSGTEAAATAAVRASTRAAAESASRTATATATSAALRNSAQATQRSATSAAISASNRTAANAASAQRTNTMLQSRGLFGLDARTNSVLGVRTNLAGPNAQATSGNSVMLNSGFGAAGTANSQLFQNHQINTNDSAAFAGTTARTGLNATLTARSQAQADADARIRAQLAAVDRMRDEALETGNEVMLEQADRIEARIRAIYRTSVQAQQNVSNDNAAQIQSGPISGRTQFASQTKVRAGADANSGASADAAVETRSRIGFGFFNRFNDSEQDRSADEDRNRASGNQR